MTGCINKQFDEIIGQFGAWHSSTSHSSIVLTASLYIACINSGCEPLCPLSGKIDTNGASETFTFSFKQHTINLRAYKMIEPYYIAQASMSSEEKSRPRTQILRLNINSFFIRPVESVETPSLLLSRSVKLDALIARLHSSLLHPLLKIFQFSPSLTALPPVCSEVCLSFIEARELCAMASVCKQMHDLSSSNELWKQQLRQDFGVDWLPRGETCREEQIQQKPIVRSTKRRLGVRDSGQGGGGGGGGQEVTEITAERGSRESLQDDTLPSIHGESPKFLFQHLYQEHCKSLRRLEDNRRQQEVALELVDPFYPLHDEDLWRRRYPRGVPFPGTLSPDGIGLPPPWSLIPPFLVHRGEDSRGWSERAPGGVDLFEPPSVGPDSQSAVVSILGAGSGLDTIGPAWSYSGAEGPNRRWGW